MLLPNYNFSHDSHVTISSQHCLNYIGWQST